MDRFTKVLDSVVWRLAGVAAFVLFFMVVAVCFATLSRYLVNKPFAPLVDLTSYSLVWVAFLAAPWLMRQRRHVVIDLFITRVGPRAQLWWRAATDFAMVIIALVLAYVGARLTIDYIANGRVMTDFLRTPQWIVLIPIPVGSFFLALASAVNGIEDVKQARCLLPPSAPASAAPAKVDDSAGGVA